MKNQIETIINRINSLNQVSFKELNQTIYTSLVKLAPIINKNKETFIIDRNDLSVSIVDGYIYMIGDAKFKISGVNSLDEHNFVLSKSQKSFQDSPSIRNKLSIPHFQNGIIYSYYEDGEYREIPSRYTNEVFDSVRILIDIVDRCNSIDNSHSSVLLKARNMNDDVECLEILSEHVIRHIDDLNNITAYLNHYNNAV